MKRQKVLFVCIHNSARSQMAEAFVRHFAADRLEAHSAGLQPGTLNPVVVEVMKEIGIDISRNRTKSVNEFLDKKENFDYAVTVCDESHAEQCPVFPGLAEGSGRGGPGSAKRIHWGFEDPSSLAGSPEANLQKIRIIRDQIKNAVLNWLDGLKNQ
jgi:arsenate reductase